jgi:hypothetical protein
VLKPGGRVAVSDVIADPDMDAATKADMQQWTGCVAGALTEQEFTDALTAGGFTDIEIRPTHRRPRTRRVSDRAPASRRPNGSPSGGTGAMNAPRHGTSCELATDALAAAARPPAWKRALLRRQARRRADHHPTLAPPPGGWGNSAAPQRRRGGLSRLLPQT